MEKNTDNKINFTEKDLNLMDRLIDWGDGEEYIRAYDVIKDLTKLLNGLNRPSVYDVHDLEIVISGKYGWDIVNHFLNEIEFTQEGHSVAHEMDEELNFELDNLIEEAPRIKLISKTKFAVYENLVLLSGIDKAKTVAFLKKEFKD